MENKKISISLSTIIIIAVIIGALFLGFIFFVIYNHIDKDNNFNSYQSNNDQQSSSNFNSKEQASGDDTYLNNQSSIDNSNSSSKPSNSSTQQNSSSTQTTSITGKTSSQSNPLSIGDWGIASKYQSKKYIDVPVKVTNIQRGTSAAEIVKNYCNSSSSIYRYEEPEEDMEWAVVDYTVDLTNIEDSSIGKEIKLNSKIIGTGDSTSIKYNNKVYIVSTMNMTSGYSKENIANGQFAVTLPIGCTDYIIVLGSPSNTQAFFKGK